MATAYFPKDDRSRLRTPAIGAFEGFIVERTSLPTAHDAAVYAIVQLLSPPTPRIHEASVAARTGGVKRESVYEVSTRRAFSASRAICSLSASKLAKRSSSRSRSIR